MRRHGRLGDTSQDLGRLGKTWVGLRKVGEGWGRLGVGWGMARRETGRLVEVYRSYFKNADRLRDIVRSRDATAPKNTVTA